MEESVILLILILMVSVPIQCVLHRVYFITCPEKRCMCRFCKGQHEIIEPFVGVEILAITRDCVDIILTTHSVCPVVLCPSFIVAIR